MHATDKQASLDSYIYVKPGFKPLQDNALDVTYLEEKEVVPTSLEVKDDRSKYSVDNNSMKSDDQASELQLAAFSNKISKTESRPESLLNELSTALTKDLSNSQKQLALFFDTIKTPEDLMKALEAYKPISKEIEKHLADKKKAWKIRRYRNAIFFGELWNGHRHGKGVMLYESLSVYEGDWENNLKHGNGIEITRDGCCYEGEYKNGKPDGFGVFLWPNGEKYEGEWKNGSKHGSGLWQGTKGESYVGEWVMGKQEGYGVFTWRNGEKYEGEFVNYLKHGHGKEKFRNGDYYVGSYSNGKPNGFGEYYWVDGRQYKGAFQNGLRHGKGVWKGGIDLKETYDGEWVNDKKCGFGVYQWRAKNYYKGNYFDDLREGYGEMVWADGTCYKGYWHKGEMHGQGTLSRPDHEALEGIFEGGIYVGTQEVEETSRLNRSMEIGRPMSKTRQRPISKKVDVQPRLPNVLNGAQHDSSFRSETENSRFSVVEKRGKTPKSEIRLPILRSLKEGVSFHSIRARRGIAANKIEKSTVESSESGRELKESHCSDCGTEKETTTTKKSRSREKFKSSYLAQIVSNVARSKGYRDKSSVDSRSSERKCCRACDPKVFESQSPNNKMKSMEEIYLSRKELTRWNVIKNRIGFNPKQLENLEDPAVCKKIRQLLRPPVWHPNDLSKTERGKSELSSRRAYK